MATWIDEIFKAVPVVGWDASDGVWLEARRSGLGGSDVSAALGFSRYRSPWDVWREKTGERPLDGEPPSEAAALGTALEPWLLGQAEAVLDAPVYLTPARTYAHPDHDWRRCSPDGVLADGRLVECKTAGLASGFGTPPGWADERVPLGYEFQCRWSMHVMDAPAVEVIGLVAGLGLVRRTIERDAGIEFKLVSQLGEWWDRHVVAGAEPPLSAADAALIAELYPSATAEEVALDGTDAAEHWETYLAAREREKAAKAEKEAAGAELKALIGDAAKGTVEGHVVASWSNKAGSVDYKRYAADLAELLAAEDIPAPDPGDYRKPGGRAFSVKEIK
ncbi:hypothetical protein GCM10027447_12750 [Glycomyces halotolerans]